MVLWHAERGLLFETLETTELSVIEGKPSGTHGFGYDPIMLALEVGTLTEGAAVQSFPRTMADLTMAEKNRISHRSRAFQKVLAFLRQFEESGYREG